MMDYPQSLIRYPHTNNSLLSSGSAKKATTYEPRTEAISPAINDDIISVEDSTSKSTKDEQTLLVEKLKKVEAEIIQTDLQIVRLRRQKEQLEQAASSHNKHDDDQENVCDTKQLSIAKLVYHENKSKAQRAHAKLDFLGSCPRDLPIYNQPSDNTIFHSNVAKFNSSFKANLISYFRQRLNDRVLLEESVSSEYDRRMERWLKKIEAEDSQPSKRVKDAKTREFFEKQFPELKKARESGERFSRVGQRVARSDAEVAELLDGITEREDQDKKVKSYAVIPPMLEEMRSRKPKFINTNGYVEDLIAEYKEHQILNIWTDEEKEIFKENYLQHPKDFGLIARMTSRKTVADCVQYYYLSKKGENYKQLLKRQQKRRTRSFVRPAQSTPATNPTAVESNNDPNKHSNSNINNCNRQAGDNGLMDLNGAPEQTESSKTSVLVDQINKGPSEVDSDVNSLIDASCCICNCNLSNNNQFRNVTRSNYQIYGIGRDTLKPGMKICYPCRFRHVTHPSFDEPYVSPEPMECHEDLQPTEMMDIEIPVIKTDTKPSIDLQPVNNDVVIPLHPLSPLGNLNQTQQLSNSNPDDENKGPKRTCVRDIIYQAIEMSFQKPKASDAMDIKQEPVRTDGLITTPINPIVPPHPIASNVLTPKPMGMMAMPINPNVMPQKPIGMGVPVSITPNVMPPKPIGMPIPMPMSPLVTIPPNLGLRQHMQERHYLHLRQQQFQAPRLPSQQQQHPLNLCRTYAEPLYVPEPANPSPKNRPPPMAHSGKSQYSHGGSDDGGVLNLSAKQSSITTAAPDAISPPLAPKESPPTVAMPVPVSVPMALLQAPSITLAPVLKTPMPTPISVAPISTTTAITSAPSMSPAPAASVVAATKKEEKVLDNEELNATKDVAEPTQTPKSPEHKSEPISPPASAKCQSPRPIPSSPPPPPTGREDSRSPNLTGSPTSPSEMVIDESAEVGSPSSSSSESEEKKDS